MKIRSVSLSKSRSAIKAYTRKINAFRSSDELNHQAIHMLRQGTEHNKQETYSESEILHDYMWQQQSEEEHAQQQHEEEHTQQEQSNQDLHDVDQELTYIIQANFQQTNSTHPSQFDSNNPSQESMDASLDHHHTTTDTASLELLNLLSVDSTTVEKLNILTSDEISTPSQSTASKDTLSKDHALDKPVPQSFTDKKIAPKPKLPMLISSASLHLSIAASAWEILWITLKLAKVFPHTQCIHQQTHGGELSIYDLQKIRMHIQHVLFMSMESGDFLMHDLTLSDVDPQVAFMPGDIRQTHYLDRASLDRLLAFIQQVTGNVVVRPLRWNKKS